MKKQSFEAINNIANKLDYQKRFAEANVFDKMLKSLAYDGRTFEQGLREGLESAVTLLERAEDMDTVKEITEYLRDVKDNIPRETATDVIYQTHQIETPEEMRSLMAFDD